MSKAKIAVTIESKTLHELDRLVEDQLFTSRSNAIQEAVEEVIQKVRHDRLDRELAKIDPKEFVAWAELGLAADAKEWPKY